MTSPFKRSKLQDDLYSDDSFSEEDRRSPDPVFCLENMAQNVAMYVTAILLVDEPDRVPSILHVNKALRERILAGLARDAFRPGCWQTALREIPTSFVLLAKHATGRLFVYHQSNMSETKTGLYGSLVLYAGRFRLPVRCKAVNDDRSFSAGHEAIVSYDNWFYETTLYIRPKYANRDGARFKLGFRVLEESEIYLQLDRPSDYMAEELLGLVAKK